MKVSPDSHISPRRPLAAEVLQVLRQDLQAGKWIDRLPSERVLSDLLQVSRPVLRSALAVLEREQVIRRVPGKCTIVLRRPRALMALRKVKIVRILFSNPIHTESPSILYTIGELRRRLLDVKHELEIQVDARLNGPDPSNVLKKLVRQNQTACWMLHSASEAVQRWFSAQQLPAIVVGSRYPGIDLPALDLDRAAIGQHAAGLLKRFKHQRIALLLRSPPWAGVRLLETGFHAAAPPPMGSIVRHNGTVDGVCSVLDNLLRKPERPTGLLVAGAFDLLTTMGYLMHTQRRIPEDISVVCVDVDKLLAHVYPPVARYTMDWELYARKLSRLILQTTSVATTPSQQHLMWPDFENGQTVGVAPDF